MIWLFLLSIYKSFIMKTNSIILNQDGEASAQPIPQQLYKKHFRRPEERPFFRDERSVTTLLLGGLSSTHDRLIAAALNSLGLKAQALPPTDLTSFELGREYGNNGYCNPAYFTVGNLLNFLKKLEGSGLSKQDIINQYAFLTAGCNSPCRFGLMEIEYRMALKEAGFQGFRVLVFKKEGGLSQSIRGVGIEINPPFILSIVNAINIADVLNGFANLTRPFEVISGKTNQVKEQAIVTIANALKNKRKPSLHPKANAIFQWLGLENAAFFIYVLYNQLTSQENVRLLKEISTWFSEIEIDPLRSKTIVKVTGELWAVTTEGDGNYSMHNFLENEGAAILIEPVATYIQFMLHKHILRHTDRKEVILNDQIKHWWQIKKRIGNWFTYKKKLWMLWLGYKLYRREYARLLNALGGNTHMLIEQQELLDLAHHYYHSHIEGGEGYMEIAKNIYYHKKSKCHMVLSLKPFGCMPSTQSDGVQTTVMEHYKNMIFLPIETSGEGKTNAHNRVLMALADAREKSKQELKEALAFAKHNVDELRNFVNQHPELRTPGYRYPKKAGVAGRAPNAVYHIEELLNGLSKN
jgi:predicted nucleotide-binding protein (sugar kinase/HSP70/actin superfamily)